MRKQIQAINEVHLFQQFERFRVMRSRVFPFGVQLALGELYMIHSSFISAFTEYFKIIEISKVKNYKTMSLSRSESKTVPIKASDLESLYDHGEIKLITSDEDLHEGEVDIEDIKDVITNLGLPKLIGLPISKIVRRMDKYITIDLGEDPSIQLEFHLKVLEALKRRGIQPTKGTDTQHIDIYVQQTK